MMRKLLFAAAFLLPMLTVAQDAAVVQLSLQQAKAYARANSYETKGAAIDIQQADKDIWRATSLLMPQVSGSIGFNNFINLPTSVVEADAFFPDIPGLPLPPPDPNAPPQELQFGMPWSSTAGINASQVLFNGSYIIGLKGAKGLRQLQASKGRMVEHEVMAATEESYITALVAAENAKMLKANVDNMKKTLRETSALFETGFLEQIDVSQVELLLLNLESQIALAERQADAARNLLKYTIGMDVDTPIELTDGLELLWQSSDPEALLGKEFNPMKNVSYEIVNQDVTMHRYLTKLEEAKYYPTLNAFFTHEEQAFRKNFNFFSPSEKFYPFTLWGVSLNIPLWDNLGNAALIKKAKLEEQRKRDQLVNVREGLKLRYVTSRNDFVTALEQLENSKKGLGLARTIRDGTLVKYREGISTSMELTQTENQLTQSQTDYINRLFGVMDAKLKLSRVFEE